LTLIEDVSGYVDQNTNKPLHISNVSCGRKHCILTFEYGAFFIWGDNEYGQLGDKKRRFIESPFPKKKFEQFHNVENVICGIDSCAVIVEDIEDKFPRGERKKKRKRTITKDQMISSPEQLKKLTETHVVRVQEEKKSVTEKLREKWHNKLYGTREEKESHEVKQVNDDKVN